MTTGVASRPLAVPAWAWLAAALVVVAHGCHGDADTELSAWPARPEAPARPADAEPAQ